MIALAFLFVSALSANAQQERVSKQIYTSAYKVATDTKEDVNVRKAASFKVDAITYLNTRTLSAIVDTTSQLSNKEIAHLNAQLDSMAYYMHEYVNLFTKEYARAVKQRDKDRILKIFRDTSINHPLYNDPDKDLVLAYFNREDYLTQFSLDTDWIGRPIMLFTNCVSAFPWIWSQFPIPFFHCVFPHIANILFPDGYNRCKKRCLVGMQVSVS